MSTEFELPPNKPKYWPKKSYDLLRSARAYIDDPNPPSRASILTSRLIELADTTKQQDLRKYTLRLFRSSVLGRGYEAEKWALSAYFSLRDRAQIDVFLDILSNARDKVLFSKADALVRAFEKQLEPTNSTAHIVIAMRLEHHTHQQLAEPMLVNWIKDSDGQHIQETIFNLWLHPTDEARQNGVRGCAYLRLLYQKLDIIERMALLRSLPDELTVELLPFLAALANETLSTQHPRVLALCKKIGHPDAEPIILTLLDSPHERVLQSAAEAAGVLGSRRCLAKLQDAATRTDSRAIQQQINAAIAAIEARHEDRKIEEGALSLSEFQGPGGALTMTEKDQGALTLYERVALGTQTAMVSTTQTTSLQQWQNLAPAPRQLPTGLVPQLFFRDYKNAAFAVIAAMYGIVAIVIYLGNSAINMQQHASQNMGALPFFCYMYVFGTILCLGLLSKASSKAKLLQKGKLAQGRHLRSHSTKNTDGRIVMSYDMECIDTDGNTSVKHLKGTFTATSGDFTPVIVGHDQSDVILLNKLPVKVSDEGQLESSAIWTGMLAGVITSHLGLWIYLLYLLSQTSSGS